LSAVAQVFFVAGFAAPLLPVGELVVLFGFNSVSALAVVRRSLSDSPSGDRSAHRHERANPNSRWPSEKGHRGNRRHHRRCARNRSDHLVRYLADGDEN
jgi:hypothetical protein